MSERYSHVVMDAVVVTMVDRKEREGIIGYSPGRLGKCLGHNNSPVDSSHRLSEHETVTQRETLRLLNRVLFTDSLRFREYMMRN